MTGDLQQEIHQLHAGICQALSEPKRIAILYELRDSAKNVGDLAGALDLNQTTVSRHLKVLREQSLVATVRDGTNIYYSLADERIVRALDLLREVLASTLAQRRALADAMR